MDPILEEMRRVKNIADIRPSRFRDWTDHLARRIAELELALDIERVHAKPKPKVNG